MKKILLILLMLSLVAAAWAGGQKETIELTVLNNGNAPVPEGFDNMGYKSYYELCVGEFMKANPNIKVTILVRDVSKGSLTADALMAAGTPPDVWWDAAGYFTKYLVPEYALPLEKYMKVDKYQKDLVDLYTRDGHVYAVPVVNVVAAMAINTSMLKEIGYTMPAQKDWTTDEFVSLAKKLKAKGYPATIIMTKSGMITWNMAWLDAFGAKMFKNIDHSKLTINSPEAVKALNYMKMLVDEGFAVANPNELTDDDGVELFTTYKVFSCMMQNGHVDGWVPEQVKQGKLKEPFDYDFVEFPHEPGRAHTALYGYQTLAVAHKSESEAKNKAIAGLVTAVSNDFFQKYIVSGGGGFPTWEGMKLPDNMRQSSKNLAGLATTAGLMDIGQLEPEAPEIRRAWLVPVQEFFAGKITAQECLDRFSAEAQAILDK